MHSRAPLPALVLIALALLVAGAGCTADPAADTPAPALRPDPGLIAPETLASFVPPAPAGWRLLAPPSPVVLEEDGIPFVSVTASYVSADGARAADLAIQDAAGRPAGLRRLADDLAAGANGTPPPPVMLGGRPALTTETGGVASACIVVADRYVAWITVAGGTRPDLEAFAAALDLDGLAGLR
jgi:hypothetical protein